MSDLISRQDTVNEIHKYFFEEINKTPLAKDEDGYEVFTDMPMVNSLLAYNKELSKRIKALPSADRPTGWIPVSEELPSKGQVVLAIDDKGTWDVGKFQGTAGWTDDERMWLWKKKTVKRVDYWMPKDAIPLPNREDGE